MKSYLLLILCSFMMPAMAQDIATDEEIAYRVLEKDHYFKSYAELWETAEIVVRGFVVEKDNRRQYTGGDAGKTAAELQEAYRELTEKGMTGIFFETFVTDNTINVTDVLKGDLDNYTIEVTQWGGNTPYGKYRQQGTPQLRKGTQVLLFLTLRRDVSEQHNPTWWILGDNDGYLLVSTVQDQCVVHKPARSSSNLKYKDDGLLSNALIGIGCEYSD